MNGYKMTFLTDLAIDCLDIILSHYAPGYAVLNLWLCGNRRLNSLLCNGAVTSITLVDRRATERRFPTILLHLAHLKRLHINRGGFRLGLASDLAEALRSLSVQLEELRLDVADAEFTLADPDTAYNLTWLLYPDECVNRTARRLWDIKASKPNLKTLSLLGGRSFLLPEDFISLPSSLSELNLVHIQTFGDFKLLPLNITSISWQTPNLTREQLLFQLPAHLLTLNLRVTNGRLPYCPVGEQEQAFLALPRGLHSVQCCLSMDFPERHYNPLPITLLGQILQAVPLQLDALSIGSLASFGTPESKLQDEFVPLLRFLPSQLTKLVLEESNIEATGALISMLPKTLTELSCGRIPWNSISSDSSLFPPRLHTLTLQLSAIPDIDCVKKLPQTLTTLSIMGGYIDYKCIAFLPPPLTSLSANICFPLDRYGNILPIPGYQPEAIGAEPTWSFPSSLSKLFLGSYASTPARPYNLFAKLPATLTHLSLTKVFRVGDEDMSKLPKTLKILRISAAELSTACFFLLPPTLTILHLSSIDGIAKAEHLKALPRTLRELKLQGGIHIDDDSFQYLPPLRLLHISGGALFNPACFKYLPRSLTSLIITIARMQPSQGADLPNLVSLELSGTSPIPTAAAQFFPLSIVPMPYSFGTPQATYAAFLSRKHRETNGPQPLW